MNKPREQLIAELSADLTPVSGAGRSAGLTLAWLLAAGVFSLAALLLGGPLRPGSAAQLIASPQFLGESLLGVATIVALAAAGLRLSIPSLRAPLASAVPALVLLACWVGFYLYGLVEPALAPSMLGKRELCWFDTAVIGLPALLLAFYAARRGWPLHGAWSGFLLGLAAGAIPALLMQFLCMYIPQHNLLFHLLPGLALGPLGAIAGVWLLRPR